MIGDKLTDALKEYQDACKEVVVKTYQNDRQCKEGDLIVVRERSISDGKVELTVCPFKIEA